MTLKKELGELKSLGVFGICKGAYNIIFSSKKILYQIILAYFLFLTLITLTEIQLTGGLFGEFPLQIPTFQSQTWSSFKDEVLNWTASQFTHEWTWYWLLKFAYFLIHVFHYTLFSSAVVYTVACIYTTKPINFRNIMGRAPKAMVNLFITNLCSLVAFLGYSFAALALLLGFVRLTKYDTAQVFSVIGIIALPITYLISLPYILISWRLACSVSMLEDMYGFKAIIKSFSLIEGKVLCAGIIFVMVKGLEIETQQGWMALVEYGKFEGVSKLMMIWILYNPLLKVEILVGFVVQIVIYLVCKSYHHDSIDKSRSADHLEVIMVDYALLNNNEQFTKHEFFVGSKSD